MKGQICLRCNTDHAFRIFPQKLNPPFSNAVYRPEYLFESKGGYQWRIQDLERGVSCACPQYQPRPLLMDMHMDAMKVAAAVLTASNCRETESLLLTTYTSSKGVSVETVETPLDPPLVMFCYLTRIGF